MTKPTIDLEIYINDERSYDCSGNLYVDGEHNTYRSDVTLCALYIDDYEQFDVTHIRNNQTPGFFDRKTLYEFGDNDNGFLMTSNYILMSASNDETPPRIKSIHFGFEMPTQDFIHLRRKFWGLIDEYEEQIKACINSKPETIPLLKKQISMILNYCTGHAAKVEYNDLEP